MGMHFGLVAIKGAVSDIKAAIPELWPTFEITASADNFTNTEAVWSWMKEHEHFVSASTWTKEHPGTQCSLITQHGPWAIYMDPSYVHASDEKALKSLSNMKGVVLSFVIETTGGCAYFSCYESGQLRRSINNTDGEVQLSGSPLPEEQGINVDVYYMKETEELMQAFGLPTVEKLPIPGATITIALTDRTDYSDLMNKNKPSKLPGGNPWWKFW